MKNIYETIAKEYADHELDTIYYTVKAAVLYGLQKGCEIERGKAENIGRTEEDNKEGLFIENKDGISPIVETMYTILYYSALSGNKPLTSAMYNEINRGLMRGAKEISTEIAKLLPSSQSQENDVNVELLEALKSAQILLSENLPSIRGWRNSELCKMTDNNPEFSQDDYNAKAAEIYNENKYADSLLKKINTFISKYETIQTN